MLTCQVITICCSFPLCVIRKPLCLVSLSCYLINMLLYAVHYYYVLSENHYVLSGNHDVLSENHYVLSKGHYVLVGGGGVGGVWWSGVGAILFLPLIQEGQFSVTGERRALSTGKLPRRLNDCARNA